MKSSFFIMLIAVLFLSACNNVFEIGIENEATKTVSTTASADDTRTPTATVVPATQTSEPTMTEVHTPTMAPTAWTLPTPTMQSTPTSRPIATHILPTSVPPAPTRRLIITRQPTVTAAPVPGMTATYLYLIALNDGGQAGKQIGCGDSVIPVQVVMPTTQKVLRASLEALLSNKSRFYGQSGLYNALYQSDLHVQSATIDGGKATVNLTGTLVLGGVCDNPRVEAQITETTLRFSTVQTVAVFINGKTLAEALSLK
jgi:hypothetical protein